MSKNDVFLANFAQKVPKMGYFSLNSMIFDDLVSLRISHFCPILAQKVGFWAKFGEF